MLKFMLDTEISIYPIKRRPELVRTAFNQHVGQMCVSAITQMELIFGAEKSSHPARKVDERGQVHFPESREKFLQRCPANSDGGSASSG